MLTSNVANLQLLLFFLKYIFEHFHFEAHTPVAPTHHREQPLVVVCECRWIPQTCITSAPQQPAVKKPIPGCSCNPCHLLCTLSNQSDKPFNYLDLFVLFYLGGLFYLQLGSTLSLFLISEVFSEVRLL